MLSFLSPIALLGLSLLAIPIAVHIFKPRRVRVTPFSSLRWLHLTQHRLSRRIRWHQVLLFIVRALALLLFVLALAKPVLSSRGSGGVSERFIIVDVSRSMGVETPGRRNPIELAKEVAADLMIRSFAGDRTAVLATGVATRVVAPLSRQPEASLPSLASLHVTGAETNLASALDPVRAMLADRRPGAGVELTFITDNHAHAWDQGAIASFIRDIEQPIRVRVIDVGVVGAQNAWIAEARVLQVGARRVIRVQASCMGDAAQKRTLRLRPLPGNPERTATLALEPGRPASVDFELPASFDTKGKVASLVLEPADSLSSDDEFLLNMDARGALRVMILEGESTQVTPLRPGFHLRTAIEALAQAAGGAIDWSYKTASSVAANEIADADVIFMAGVPDMTEANLGALEGRIRAGGGLAIFLGPGVKTDFYNTRMYKAAAPREGLMPGSIKPGARPDPRTSAGLPVLSGVSWGHPMLAPLLDPVLGDLGRVTFSSYCPIELPANSDSAVLASIGDSAPALIEHSFGAGKVLLFNTSPNDEWTDLPRRKSFVPLIDRVLSHLSRGGARRWFEVDQPIALSLPEPRAGERWAVVTPSGARLTPQASTSGGRTVLQIDPMEEVGVYRAERESFSSAKPAPAPSKTDGNKEAGAAPASASPAPGARDAVAFVVQPGRGDSLMATMDAATLQRWWHPAAFEVLSVQQASESLAVRHSRVALWPWSIMLGAAMLLLEFYLVHRLCPKMNPSVASSNIHRRGMFSWSSRDQGSAEAAP